MPRITVMAECSLPLPYSEEYYDKMGMDVPEPEKCWRRRRMYTDDIYTYEELDKKHIQVETLEGQVFRVKENYDAFSGRLDTLEETEIVFNLTEEGREEGIQEREEKQ